ncbi:hypothetical protein [Streptomyces cavourensis]|uniref:hypothetical protein n=1 Tax=Streptomyces cavourensis TaxID=67258 RepID=UPI0020C950AA|nr:hypothetical protein [Streptomyces cavourensis]
MDRSHRSWWTEIAIGSAVTVAAFFVLSALASATAGPEYAAMGEQSGWLIAAAAVAAGVWAAARYRRR